jgi:predicted metal-dependent phosphoesterase TrpH
MKKFILAAIGLAFTLSASAQFYYQDSNNVDMLRHARTTGIQRTEIILPQVNGYNVYKADLHLHTIYSDGSVTPEYRVGEAWNDGLDVVASTEHVEYRPHEGKMISFLKGYVKKGAEAVNTNLVGSAADKEGIQTDLNHSVRCYQSAAAGYGITVIPGAEITRNPGEIGHYNALFTTDNNVIYDPDPAQSMRNARAQGAIIMQNHPGWTRKDVSMMDFETKVYNEGLIDGIEIMNGSEFYPKAITRAKVNGFFMSSNTDAHNPTYEAYKMVDTYRNMTLIFAKDKSLEALKEALLAHRTLAYSYGSIAGEEQLLKDFFKASMAVSVLNVNPSNGKRTVSLTNMSSFAYLLDFGGNPVLLNPFSSIRRTVGPEDGIKMTVANMWCGEDAHPEVVIEVK